MAIDGQQNGQKVAQLPSSAKNKAEVVLDTLELLLMWWLPMVVEVLGDARGSR